MVGWHHRLNGCKSKQTPGDSEGQGSQASVAVHGVSKSQTQLSYRKTIFNPMSDCGVFLSHLVPSSRDPN